MKRFFFRAIAFGLTFSGLKSILYLLERVVFNYGKSYSFFESVVLSFFFGAFLGFINLKNIRRVILVSSIYLLINIIISWDGNYEGVEIVYILNSASLPFASLFDQLIFRLMGSSPYYIFNLITFSCLTLDLMISLKIVEYFKERFLS